MKTLMFMIGRTTSYFKGLPDDHDMAITTRELSAKVSLWAETTITVFKARDMWSEEYQTDTDNAIQAGEWWFQVYSEPGSPPYPIYTTVHPHLRWLDVKDRLDENNILY